MTNDKSDELVLDWEDPEPEAEEVEAPLEMKRIEESEYIYHVIQGVTKSATGYSY